MSGAETDTNTVREALTKLVPRWPCELCVHDHCACTETSRVALAALSRLSGRVTELEQENAEDKGAHARAALAGSAGQEQA
jgi:hypothetical protein